ncbi:MAG: hypothetical protein JSW60_03790 [Thermoplasmatales archaeon]|nr:MAG: hypothetical protein JSW60_03790 [Thermoplasmatales archaeon]
MAKGQYQRKIKKNTSKNEENKCENLIFKFIDLDIIIICLFEINNIVVLFTFFKIFVMR